MSKEPDSMKPDTKNVDETKAYNKREPDPKYPYINKNIRKTQYYKEHKEEVEDIISWLKKSHGDE